MTRENYKNLLIITKDLKDATNKRGYNDELNTLIFKIDLRMSSIDNNVNNFIKKLEEINEWINDGVDTSYIVNKLDELIRDTIN